MVATATRWVALGVVLAIVGCGGGDKVTLEGTVTAWYGADAMIDDPGGAANKDGRCLGAGNFEGSQVVITDEGGDVIATARLEEGTNDVIGCKMPFDVQVPDSDFYTVSFGDGGGAVEETFSKEDLEDADWHVDLTYR